MDRNFVVDPVRHHDAGLALAPRVERQHPSADLDVDVPRRAPARFAVDAGHGASDGPLDPCREPLLLDGGRVIWRHRAAHGVECI